MTSSHETERAYSYNPGASTGAQSKYHLMKTECETKEPWF